jgi:pyruvate,water dikinase
VNSIEPQIKNILNNVKTKDISSLEDVSLQIQSLFAAGAIPSEIIKEINIAYEKLSRECFKEGNKPCFVAVRSSATAEDLPDMSFAGQQDTYLNIVGNQSLVESIVRCWGSLWTARAIGYRFRNNVKQEDIALAVVVQQMVASEASGVMFTANPLTGKRTETVIDATFGLGEALVSGQVEPDNYVIDTKKIQIIKKSIGTKAFSIHANSHGGTVNNTQSANDHQALSDNEILELVQIGLQTASYFNSPQDIEWAMEQGHLYLVQSRPITSLYPIPSSSPNWKTANDNLQVWFSFASWQGMLDPITPLGQDTFRYFATSMGRLLGFHVEVKNQNTFVNAGERLYINLTPPIRSELGRKIVPIFIASIEPTIINHLKSLYNDPQLAIKKNGLGFGTKTQFIRVIFKILFKVIRNFINPVKGRKNLIKRIDSFLENLRVKDENAKDLSEQVEVIEQAFIMMPGILFPVMLSGGISGIAPMQMLFKLANSLPDGAEKVLELTRGLSYNVTTEMDLALWRTSMEIKKSKDSYECFANSEASLLTSKYLNGDLPSVAQSQIKVFLEKYGARGIAEIDIGRQRWAEDPIHIIQVLKGYLQIKDEKLSPVEVFKRGAQSAVQAQEQLIEEFKKVSGGFIKHRVAKFIASRLRELGGLRETPKFAFVRMLSIYRNMLLKSGRQLVQEGVIKNQDDLFYLHLDELKKLATNREKDWNGIIEERRRKYEREQRRKRIPRLMLSDGTAFYEGFSEATSECANILNGIPVSSGVCEGLVRVVFNPQEDILLPGEILVCPATDPAWTPLFLLAGGLILEVGGMMTHGAVVAREYGIPAVVGVNQATLFLKTGQHIRMDGSTGQIEILDEKIK